jgi:hypothetical protein
MDTETEPSTFFPDSWSRAQVVDEIREAFNNISFIGGNYWEGVSPSGIKIGGYFDSTGDINTAFPRYE